ncbi:MAG: serine hydrolase [Pseudomonadota bacterium]
MIRLLTKLSIAALLGLSISSAATAFQSDADTAAEDAVEIEQVDGGIDANKVKVFFDGAVGAIQKVYDIPGVTVSVVKDGRLLYSGGYGHLDVARTRPVDPATSLFRIGSISKLFTYTAVMQLVERGQLDLDADVNDYLTAFKIDDTYPEPVTLRHILTHTAGFEDGGMGYLFRKQEGDLIGFEEWLIRYQPKRVRPPGTFASYSNYATGLAGYIVAEVSGSDFETYIDENIFEPLGMSHSTFREPVPADIADAQSGNLRRELGDYVDSYFEFIADTAPAGSMSSSADDMAQFMLAHLGSGAVGDDRILREATALQMREPLFTHHPKQPGMLYGFVEYPVNGRFGYGHGGDTLVFHSEMVLVPSENFGVFLSTNAADGGVGVRQLLAAILDEFVPDSSDNPHPSPATDSDVDLSAFQKYAGSYRGNRRAYSNWQKILELPSDLQVQVSPNGGLVLPSFFAPAKFQRYVETNDEGVFRSVDDPDAVISFREDDNGNVTQLFISPVMAHDKIGGLESAKLHQSILGLSLLVFVAVVVGSIRRFKLIRALPALEKRAWIAVFLASLVNVVFAIALVGAVAGGLESLIFTGLPAAGFILSLPVIAGLFTIWAILQVPGIWAQKVWTFWARIRYMIIVVFLILFALILNYWKVFGPWNTV